MKPGWVRLFLVCMAGLQLTASGVASAQSPGPRHDRRVTFEPWRPIAPVFGRVHSDLDAGG